MTTDILYRSGLTVVIVALGLIAYGGWNWWQLRRVSRTTAGQAPGLESRRPGAAAVLYFTTDGCTLCRTVQKPALEQVQAALGDRVQVIEVNAAEQPAVADHWGVLSVPTTFVIDRQGQPRSVNHGAANQAKLTRQLAAVVAA